MPILMTMLVAPFRCLLHDRCALARALSQGVRIPGTNTVLQQQLGQWRFSGVEKFLFAVVGTWIFCRVVLKDEPYWWEMPDDSDSDDEELVPNRFKQRDIDGLWQATQSYRPLAPLSQYDDLDNLLVFNDNGYNAEQQEQLQYYRDYLYDDDEDAEYEPDEYEYDYEQEVEAEHGTACSRFYYAEPKQMID